MTSFNPDPTLDQHMRELYSLMSAWAETLEEAAHLLDLVRKRAVEYIKENGLKAQAPETRSSVVTPLFPHDLKEQPPSVLTDF